MGPRREDQRSPDAPVSGLLFSATDGLEVMPVDPKECREAAVRCRAVAASATDLTASEILLELANTWERLASQLEGAIFFSKAMKESEPPSS